MREHFRTVHEVGKRRKMMDAHDGGSADVKCALPHAEGHHRQDGRSEDNEVGYEGHGSWAEYVEYR